MIENKEHFRESYIEIQDLALCAALLAMGIPFCEKTPFVKIKTQHSEYYKFFMDSKSLCGQYNTLELIANWNDTKFHEDNPEHPFAYIKCAFKNREGLLDKVNQSCELIVIERNGKLAIISKNASKELQDRIFSQL